MSIDASSFGNISILKFVFCITNPSRHCLINGPLLKISTSNNKWRLVISVSYPNKLGNLFRMFNVIYFHLIYTDYYQLNIKIIIYRIRQKIYSIFIIYYFFFILFIVDNAMFFTSIYSENLLFSQHRKKTAIPITICIGNTIQKDNGRYLKKYTDKATIIAMP